MDMIWAFFIFLILVTCLVLWHEFKQKKFGWTKMKYQIYILGMMFFSFFGYGLMMYWLD